MIIQSVLADGKPTVNLRTILFIKKCPEKRNATGASINFGTTTWYYDCDEDMEKDFEAISRYAKIKII